MRPLLALLAAVIVLAAAGALYQLKHRVETRREAVRALEEQIVEDAEALRVLKAEWAYLTSPAELQPRAREHLALGPPHPDQIASSIAQLPFRGPRDNDIGPLAQGDGESAPAPRAKPTPPAMPASRDLAKSAVPPEGMQPAAQAARADESEDFSERMQAVLNRLGGER